MGAMYSTLPLKIPGYRHGKEQRKHGLTSILFVFCFFVLFVACFCLFVLEYPNASNMKNIFVEGALDKF